MRKEVWVHPISGRQFQGRDRYLEFMRLRLKNRRNARKLEAHRALAVEKLKAIHDVISFDELEEFLNDHHRDIEAAARSTEQYIRITKPFAITVEDDYAMTWQCCLTFGCEYKRTVRYSQNHCDGEYPLLTEVVHDRSVTSVLALLGFDFTSEDIVSWRSDPHHRHWAWLAKDDFSSLAVMDKIRGR